MTPWVLRLNELTPQLAGRLPATDTRLRPDVRCLELGIYDQVQEPALSAQTLLLGLQGYRGPMCTSRPSHSKTVCMTLEMPCGEEAAGWSCMWRGCKVEYLLGSVVSGFLSFCWDLKSQTAHGTTSYLEIICPPFLGALDHTWYAGDIGSQNWRVHACAGGSPPQADGAGAGRQAGKR